MQHVPPAEEFLMPPTTDTSTNSIVDDLMATRELTESLFPPQSRWQFSTVRLADDR